MQTLLLSHKKFLTAALLVLIAYFVSARLGLYLQLSESQASPIWPPTGIAFAVFLIMGYRIWPAVFIGAFLANLVDSYYKVTGLGSFVIMDFLTYLISLDKSILVSAVIGIGNTLESAVGLFLVSKFIQGNIFDSVKNINRFALIILIMCLFSSIIG